MTPKEIKLRTLEIDETVKVMVENKELDPREVRVKEKKLLLEKGKLLLELKWSKVTH